MSEHIAEVNWKRGTPDFQYETYDRSHTVKFAGGITCQASAAPDFMGNAQKVNPEEMIAGALSSCHMLTFLAVAAKSRLTVDEYRDRSVATLDKNAAGKLCVTRIALSPKVRFSTPVDAQKLKELHEKAHRNCFIANSLACEMIINPE